MFYRLLAIKSNHDWWKQMEFDLGTVKCLFNSHLKVDLVCLVILALTVPQTTIEFSIRKSVLDLGPSSEGLYHRKLYKCLRYDMISQRECNAQKVSREAVKMFMAAEL